MPRRKPQDAPSTDAGFPSSPPSAAERVDTLLDAANGRMIELHREIVNAAFAELRSGQAEFLKAWRFIVAVWPSPVPIRMQRRLAVPVAACVELSAQSQAAVFQLLCEFAAERFVLSGTSPGARKPNLVERRFHSVVIKFPDRRRAA